jgi:hypothetical protein
VEDGFTRHSGVGVIWRDEDYVSYRGSSSPMISTNDLVGDDGKRADQCEIAVLQ